MKAKLITSEQSQDLKFPVLAVNTTGYFQGMVVLFTSPQEGTVVCGAVAPDTRTFRLGYRAEWSPVYKEGGCWRLLRPDEKVELSNEN